MIILGIDLGKARTGVAICDRGELLASPLTVVNEHNRERLVERLAALARENRADAVAEGERLLAEARQEGRRLAERAKAQAEEQVKALFAQTEAAAAARREQALADNQVRCQRIKQEARGRLEQAARLIMERIGNV